MLNARSVPPRYFTPQEANELVPTIRAYLNKVRDHGRELLALEREVARAETEAQREEIRQAMDRCVLGQAHLLERILEMGAELMDPLEIGRVRFPAMRNGEPVWLIWHMGESKVEKWAPIAPQVFGPRPLDPSAPVRWEWRN